MDDELNQVSMTSSVGSSIEVLSIPKDPVEDEDFSASTQMSRDGAGDSLMREDDEFETQLKTRVDAEDNVSKDSSIPGLGVEEVKEGKLKIEGGEDKGLPKAEDTKDDSIWLLTKDFASKVFEKTKEQTKSCVHSSALLSPIVKGCLSKGTTYINNHKSTVVLVAILVSYIIQFHLATSQLQEAHENIKKIQWENDRLDKKIQGWAREIQERVSYRLAFSVWLVNPRQTQSETLVFNRVIMNIGEGYDETTGVFTAPRDGLYFFQLALASSKHCCDGHVFIKANETFLASLWVQAPESSHDQPSVSIVVELQTGNKVKVVTNLHNDDKWRGRLEVYFTGFLIQVY